MRASRVIETGHPAVVFAEYLLEEERSFIRGGRRTSSVQAAAERAPPGITAFPSRISKHGAEEIEDMGKTP